MKPDQLKLHFTMEDDAPIGPPDAQDIAEGSVVLQAALASKFSHRLDALEKLIEDRCAQLDSQIGRRMTVLEAIVQSRSAELAGQVVALDKTWAMAQAVVMELEKQLGVRLDSDKDLERRLSELSEKVVELDEARDVLPSASVDQHSAMVRLGEHMERLEASLEAVRIRCEDMTSAAEVLRSDAHGTSETTAANRQHLDVMQAQVEALQLQVEQVGSKIANLAIEENQGVQFGLQMLDRIYSIYDGIRAESEKQKQEGCGNGNVPDCQEPNKLAPALNSTRAKCLSMSKSSSTETVSGFSIPMRLCSAPSRGTPPPGPQAFLESRLSPARVISSPSSALVTPTVASRRTAPEESCTAPLRMRSAQNPQSYGNRSGSPLQTQRGLPTRSSLGGPPSRGQSPQPLPADESQTATGTAPPSSEAAAGGFAKHPHVRLAHYSPPSPGTRGLESVLSRARPLGASTLSASSNAPNGLLRATTLCATPQVQHR